MKKIMILIVAAVIGFTVTAYAGSACCGGGDLSGKNADAHGAKLKAGQCASCCMEVVEGKGIAVVKDGQAAVVCSEECAKKVNVPVSVESK